MRPRPLLVEFIGGPGCGKSTTAAKVFAALKERGVEAELVSEVAKGLTWEERHMALTYQPYIAAKQMWHYDRLRGKVDVIVSDTSLLLCTHYGNVTNGKTDAFIKWVMDDYAQRDTFTIFLRRGEWAYNARGRNQTEEDALRIDHELHKLLWRTNTPFSTMRSESVKPTVDAIVAYL